MILATAYLSNKRALHLANKCYPRHIRLLHRDFGGFIIDRLAPIVTTIFDGANAVIHINDEES